MTYPITGAAASKHEAAANAPRSRESLLRVEGLNVRFNGAVRAVHAVRDLDLTLSRGEICGLVGESGSGKSATGLAMMGLHGPEAKISGQLYFGGDDIALANGRDWQALRGRRIAMVFQNSTAALNPLRTIGSQLMGLLRLDNRQASQRDLERQAIELLDMVGIVDPARRLKDYPHEFSGGMNQRIGIAMALARQPELLIADEPTTALDVSIQAQIIALLRRLAWERQLAILFITHDLSLVTEFCDSVAVMYGGRIVETGRTAQVFARPLHRYTEALLGSMPSLGRRARLSAIPGDPPQPDDVPAGCAFAPRCPAASEQCRVHRPERTDIGDRTMTCYHPPQNLGALSKEGERAPRFISDEIMVSVTEASVAYPGRGLLRRARPQDVLDRVSLQLRKGEVLGLVGESGSGKSTLARLIMGQVSARSGNVSIQGAPRPPISSPLGRALSRRIQLVFQDSHDALDPTMTVLAQLQEPLDIHRIGTISERRERVESVARSVGLPPPMLARLPREISGGQRQRVVLARALMLEPQILVCDEPVASLDVSVQAQVINLLDDLRHQLGLTILFISHDLRLVAHLCDRVAVMYRGQIVETGDCESVFAAPRHDYTKRLIASLPAMTPNLLPGGADQ